MTDDSPSAAIARLSEQWRKDAQWGESLRPAAWQLTRCADDLDAALRACAEARPSTEKVKEDDQSRSEKHADRDRLQSSAPTDGDITTPAPNDGWRCFHCEEVFTNEAEAREHFGYAELSTPGCAITIAEFRQMEQHVADIRRENEEMSNDASMYHAQSHELERLFGKGVLSAHQAWLRWEEQESRAMAAEERLAVLEATAPPRAEALAPPEDKGEGYSELLDVLRCSLCDQRILDRGDVTCVDCVKFAHNPAKIARYSLALRDGKPALVNDPEGLWCSYHRVAEALAPHPQHVDTNPQPRCPATTIGSQIHDPARCALPVGHVGDHQVAVPPSEWQSVRIIAKQIRQAARLGTLDVGVAAEWADALEAEARAAALARSAPAEKLEVEKAKNDDVSR